MSLPDDLIYVWSCPKCDVQVRTNSANFVERVPALHRPTCAGRPERVERTVAVMPDARPVRVLPGVTVAPHVAERRGVPPEDGDDAA